MTTAITATPDTWHLVTELSAPLLELTGASGPGYRKLLILAADGKVAPPLEKRNGRWGLQASRLPELAAALGLPLKAPVAARTRASKRQSAPAETALAVA